MKNLRRLATGLMFAGLLSGCIVHAEPMHPRAVPQGSFYDVLTPYGDWVVVSGFGTVWRPHPHLVGPDFYPYFSGGHWEYTEYGWTWVSDWEWGWVPFHHGRWLVTAGYGWVWIPGDVWGPGWVDWRVGGGHVGWVPLGPPGVEVVVTAYHPRWVWLRTEHFGHRDFHHNRVMDAHDEDEAYHAAMPVPRGDRDVPRGPDPSLVAPGRQVTVVPIGPPRRLPEGAVAGERRIPPPPPQTVVPGAPSPTPPPPQTVVPSAPGPTPPPPQTAPPPPARVAPEERRAPTEAPPPARELERRQPAPLPPAREIERRQPLPPPQAQPQPVREPIERRQPVAPPPQLRAPPPGQVQPAAPQPAPGKKKTEPVGPPPPPPKAKQRK